MDYSKLSTPDLEALKAGDLSKVSSAGLNYLSSLNPSRAPDALDNPNDPYSVVSGVGLSVLDSVKNLGMGAVKGAVSIGNTLTGANEERKASQSQFFRENADPKSLPFKTGELTAEVAGTAGVGGALAKGATAAAKVSPALLQFAPKLAATLQSGGFSLGASPAATTVAGRAGDMALRVGAGAAVGGASAGLVDPSSAGTGTAVGAALPVAARAAGAATRAVAGQASSEVAALYQKAKGIYQIDIPADRLVNSRPLNAVASSLNYVPLSGRAGSEAKMVSQFNRAVSRTFGQDSDNVTMALRRASGDLGAKFEQTLSSNTVKVDNQFLNDLTAHVQTAADELSPEQAKIISKQVDNLIEKVGANGEIDGQSAYNIKKTLDHIGNRNSSEAYYARELKKSLMGALNRSLGPQEAAEFAKVRQQYGTMLDLEGLAQNGAEGGISVGRLANMKGIKNPELQDLADIAAQFVKSRENPHGSAQRVVQAVLGGGAIAGGALSPASIPAIALGIGSARGVNATLNSPALKALLSNQPPKSLSGNPVLRALLYNQAAQQETQ